VLVLVDQPTAIRALALARDVDCPVAFLPGLTMRRAEDTFLNNTRAFFGNASGTVA
jgi:hypothetical protein